MNLQDPASGIPSWEMRISGAWFLALCIVFGIVLRLWGIESKSLWDDEACTVRRIDQESAWGVFENVKESPFPPLYYLLERMTSQGRVDSSLSLRLLPLVAGLLAIPVTYFGVKSLGGNEMARWATLLTTTSAFHTHYSQDAKMYSLVWLLILCGNLGFLNLVWCTRIRPQWVIAYLLGMTLLPWTSYVGIVAQGVQAMWLAVLVWKQWAVVRRKMAILSLLLGLSSLPFVVWWAPIAIEASAHRHGIGWIPPVRDLRTSFFGFWETTASFLTGIHMAGTDPQAIAYRVIWAILAIGTVGAASLGRIRGGLTETGAMPDRGLLRTLFLIWWSMPLIGCLIFSLICYPLFGIPRFLCGAAPGLFLLISSSASAGTYRRTRILGCFVVILNLASVAWWHAIDARVSMNQIVDQIDKQGVLIPEGQFAGTPVLMATRSPGCQIREITLEVTLQMRYPSAQVVWIHWQQYRQVRCAKPILVFHESSQFQDSMSNTKHLASLPEWNCLFRQEVYEHPLTAMVDPSQGRQIEVWSWTPPQEF